VLCRRLPRAPALLLTALRGRPGAVSDAPRDRETVRRASRVRESARQQPIRRGAHPDVDRAAARSHFPNGIVSSVSFVSTTNTARSLAGLVSLALALTAWRSPGSSEKLCPAS